MKIFSYRTYSYNTGVYSSDRLFSTPEKVRAAIEETAKEEAEYLSKAHPDAHSKYHMEWSVSDKGVHAHTTTFSGKLPTRNNFVTRTIKEIEVE